MDEEKNKYQQEIKTWWDNIKDVQEDLKYIKIRVIENRGKNPNTQELCYKIDEEISNLESKKMDLNYFYNTGINKTGSGPRYDSAKFKEACDKASNLMKEIEEEFGQSFRSDLDWKFAHFGQSRDDILAKIEQDMNEEKNNGNEEKAENEENVVWEETKQEFELKKKELENKRLELLENTPVNELWKIEEELSEIQASIEEVNSNLKEIDRTVNEQEWDGANNKYVNKEEKIEEQEQKELAEEQVEEETELLEQDKPTEDQLEEEIGEQEQEELIEEVINGQDMDENIIDGDYYEVEENDENIIDADYVEIEEDRDETVSERAVRLANEYAHAQGQNIKASAKMMAYNAKEGIKGKIDDAKTAVKMGILNSPPVRFVRGVKRIAGKVFKGFKTAGNIAIGVGALTAEAVSNAKDTIQRASTQSITDLVNSGRNKVNNVLDRLEDKVVDKQLEAILKQQMLEQEKFEGR